METTPGITLSQTMAPPRTTPLSLYALTISPLFIPRLAASAGLLRLAESVIVMSAELSRLLQALEALLLMLAVIAAAFWLVNRLDYLRRLLPGNLQHRFRCQGHIQLPG